MIEGVAKGAVERLVRSIAASADLPDDLRVERDGERLAIVGSRVRLRALTDARIIALLAGPRR